MIIIPAIDIKDGRCVRLVQGRMDDATVYGDCPASMAEQWQNQGAEIIHIVDLNGAVEGRGVNDEAIRDIARRVQAPLELGGGIRDMARIDQLLDMGIGRVILGTVAVEEPDLVSEAVERHGPERILVGIDARSGVVSTRGWIADSGVSAVELGRDMRRRGIETIVYTDIARDGTLTGPNISETQRVARATGLSVIASGGISTLDDIRALAALDSADIAAAITGKALYEGRFTLAEAIAAGK